MPGGTIAVPSSGRCFSTLSLIISRGVAFKASSLDVLTASIGLFVYDMFRASRVASYGPSW